MTNETIKNKILIVDDSADNIKVLYETLKSDYEIIVATGGKSALEIAATEKPPDLILLDIMMPDMDGYEVCIRLKSDEKTAVIPVIFISALREEEDEMMGLSLGAVDYIAKPINPGIVKARVRAHLEVKHQRDYLEELIREKNCLENPLESQQKRDISLQRTREQEFRDIIEGIIENAEKLMRNAEIKGCSDLINDLKSIHTAGNDLLTRIEPVSEITP